MKKLLGIVVLSLFFINKSYSVTVDLAVEVVESWMPSVTEVKIVDSWLPGIKKVCITNLNSLDQETQRLLTK